MCEKPIILNRRQSKLSVFKLSVFLLVIFLCGIQNKANALNRYSVANGNWNSTATWSSTPGGAPGFSVPIAGDAVFIVQYIVTLNVNGACASLTIGNTGWGGTPTLNIGAFTLTVSGNVLLNGDRDVLISMTSPSSVLTIGGNLTLGPGIDSRTFTLDMSNGANNASTLNIAGSMIRNSDGIFTRGTASTVNYNGTAAQTINLANFTYAHLTTNNTNASTGAVLGAAVTAANVSGNISVNSGLFSTNNLAMTMANTRTLTVALGATMDAGTTSITMGTGATVTVNGTYKTANTLGFSGAATTAIKSTNAPTITLGASSIIEYNAAAVQTVTNRADYANVTLTGGSKTIGTAAAQTVTLSKNLTINTGAVYLGSTWNPLLNIGGDFSNSGTYTQGTALVTFNGTAAQTILGSSPTTFTNNITLNNAAGLSISTSPTINGLLTFTNGIITTGANKVILGSAATTSGAGAGKYINGNEEIFIPNAAAPSKTFNIGDAADYTPVLIAFVGTTTGSGSLIASTTAGDDPDIDNSGINSTLSVNLNWLVSQGAVPVGGFTSYSGTFDFVAGDVDGGANTANFVLRKKNGVWATTTTGTRTATSTQASGMTTFGDFQIGEARTITVDTNPADSTLCAGSSTTFISTSTSIPAPIIQWQRSDGTYSDITAILDNPNTTYSGFTTSELTLNGSEIPLTGYLYQAVFTNINGTVNSTAATLTVNSSPAITTQPANQTVCEYVDATYTVATSTGSPTYQWQMSLDNSTWVNVFNGTPAGLTYTNPNTAVLTANGTSPVALYYYRCEITDGCFRNSDIATLTIKTIPAAAGTITGSASVCQSQNGVSYSLPAIPRATSYSWAYSGTGATFSSNPSATPNITIDFSPGATSGNLTVTGVNACGNGTVSPPLSISVLSSLPAAAGAIYSESSFACYLYQYAYSVSAISGADSYLWTYSGTGFTPSGNTPAINGKFNATATSGNLTVAGVNACGSGTTSPDFAITTGYCEPHNNCNLCHIPHNAPGGSVTAVNGNPNLCMSCHNPGGIAYPRPFDNSMKAVPGTSGNSHAWGKPSVNTTYETKKTTNAEMLLRLPGDSILCSTCHNQHDLYTYFPFLRASNDGDAMCKDCHTDRNRGKYSSDPVNNKGTHPVGLVYSGTGSLKAVPTGSVTLPSGKVECSSCHQTHHASTNDGYILRQTNDAVLCTSCHNYSSHEGMDCNVCHQTHNTNKANIYMIRSVIATPNSGNKTVVFTAESGAGSFADGAAPYDGVCQVCHTQPSSNYHSNSAPGNHNNTGKCVNCHLHSNNFAPTSCVDCHSTIMGGIYTTDAHTNHITKYGFPCSTCHYQYGNFGSLEPIHYNGTINVNFDPNGLARRNGLDANTPTFNSVTKTCSNVYCHSNGRSAYRGKDATYTWSNTIGPQAAAYKVTPSWSTGKITGCNITTGCHDAMGAAAPPAGPNYTVTVPGLLSGSNYQPATGSHRTANHTDNDRGWCAGTPGTTTWTVVNCFWCHNTNGSVCNAVNNLGTYATGFHVDGQTYFKPIKYSNGGTMADWNQYASDGTGTHCGNSRQCW